MFLGVLVLFFSSLTGTVLGHGYLAEPPGRASAWRYGFNTPVDYNDNECFCGGFNYQYGQNGGKCGLCGDPWDQDPRDHEVGGIYATGTIVRDYSQGQVIKTTANITTNHLGHFEYKICPNNDATVEATQDCLDLTPLYAVDHDDWHLNIGSKSGIINFDLQLPADLTCSQCVLQWRYVTANTWGTCENGTQATGCGPQEEFRACADVSVSAAKLDGSPVTSAKKVTEPEQLASRTEIATDSDKMVVRRNRGSRYDGRTQLQHLSEQNLRQENEPKSEQENLSREETSPIEDSFPQREQMKEELGINEIESSANIGKAESEPDKEPTFENEPATEKESKTEGLQDVSKESLFNTDENSDYESKSDSQIDDDGPTAEEFQSVDNSRLGGKSQFMVESETEENSEESKDEESDSDAKLGGQQQRALKLIEEMAVTLKSNSEKQTSLEQEIDRTLKSVADKDNDDDESLEDVEEKEYDSDSDSESDDDDE